MSEFETQFESLGEQKRALNFYPTDYRVDSNNPLKIQAGNAIFDFRYDEGMHSLVAYILDFSGEYIPLQQFTHVNEHNYHLFGTDVENTVNTFISQDQLIAHDVTRGNREGLQPFHFRMKVITNDGLQCHVRFVNQEAETKIPTAGVLKEDMSYFTKEELRFMLESYTGEDLYKCLVKMVEKCQMDTMNRISSRMISTLTTLPMHFSQSNMNHLLIKGMIIEMCMAASFQEQKLYSHRFGSLEPTYWMYEYALRNGNFNLHLFADLADLSRTLKDLTFSEEPFDTEIYEKNYSYAFIIDALRSLLKNMTHGIQHITPDQIIDPSLQSITEISGIRIEEHSIYNQRGFHRKYGTQFVLSSSGTEAQIVMQVFHLSTDLNDSTRKNMKKSMIYSTTREEMSRQYRK